MKAILESGSFRASFGSQWGGGCAKRGQARVAVDLLWAAGRRVVSIVSFIHKKMAFALSSRCRDSFN